VCSGSRCSLVDYGSLAAALIEVVMELADHGEELERLAEPGGS
jgi:hypothetical protein